MLQPVNYVEFRAINRNQSSCPIEEWSRWISEFRKSRDGGVRRAASAALPLTQKDLDEYYHFRIVANRELDVLDSSSQQLRTADQQLTSLLQELQKAPAHASTSFVHDLGLTGQTTKPIAEVYFDCVDGHW